MRVIFVCLGNICRSPMAAAVMRHHPSTRGWLIDSAGTGDWHRGQPADPRTVAVLRQHGIPADHRARQVRAADFVAFDVLLMMDAHNLADVRSVRPANATARLERLGDYDPLGVRDVPDPYTGDERDFAAVFAQVTRCSAAFIARHPTA